MTRTELNYKSHSYVFVAVVFNAVKELLFCVGLHRFTDWLRLGKNFWNPSDPIPLLS